MSLTVAEVSCTPALTSGPVLAGRASGRVKDTTGTSAHTTLETVLATSRRARLDKAIVEMAHEAQWWPTVSRLQCLRGVLTLTAFGLSVEVGDWSRFSGSTIGAYPGLVPTESSSGEGRHQGSITKTGNTHARRLLVEAAWHHRRPYRPTKTMRDRWDLAPAAARARGHAGNQRLHERWVRFNERKTRG